MIHKIVKVLIGIFIGVDLYILYAKNIEHEKLPMPFGFGIAVVTSGSMEPTFSKGTVLIVQKTEKIKENDIVVYETDEELIVHRILSINGDICITKGDANNVEDTPFSKKKIKGKVRWWIPQIKTVFY